MKHNYIVEIEETNGNLIRNLCRSEDEAKDLTDKLNMIYGGAEYFEVKGDIYLVYNMETNDEMFVGTEEECKSFANRYNQDLFELFGVKSNKLEISKIS